MPKSWWCEDWIPTLNNIERVVQKYRPVLGSACLPTESVWCLGIQLSL